MHLASQSTAKRLRIVSILGCLLILPGLALAQTGEIRGTVSGAGTALSGAQVYIYNSSETVVAQTTTQTTGAFNVSGLAPGSYHVFAYTANVSGGFVSAVYPDVFCAGFAVTGSGNYCRPNSGDPVTVTGGTITSGINFDLPVGGTIVGTVTADGEAYANTLVRLHIENGTSQTIVVRNAGTSATGAYVFAGLPAGNYFVWAGGVQGGAQSGYVDELFDDVSCPFRFSIPTSGTGCTTTQATPVAVTLGDRTTVAGMDLAPAGALSGTVLTTAGAVPSNGAFINVYAGDGTTYVTSASVSSSSTGTFLVRGLVPGDYRFYTGASGYQYEVYDNIACPFNNCFPLLNTGAPVSVSAGAVARGLAIDLEPNASPVILRQPASQSVLMGEAVTLTVDAIGQGTLSYQWYEGISGNTTSPISGATGSEYTTPPVTAPVSYWVRVTNPQGSANSAAANLQPAASGTGAIAGIVSSGGTPVSRATVRIYRFTGTAASGAVELVATAPPTSAAGAFSVAGLAPGTYRAFADAGSATGEFANALYPDIGCIGLPVTGSVTASTYCNVERGGQVFVVADTLTSDTDFELSPGATIDGTVTADGEIMIEASVRLYIPGGSGPRQVLSAATDAAARYRFSRLPRGDYWVWAGNVTGGGRTGYVDEVFDGVPCPYGLGTGCLATSAATIAPEPGEVFTADFDLEPAGAISGTLSASGVALSPAQGAYVQVYGGRLTWYSSVFSDGSFFVRGLPAGPYRLEGRASGLAAELYDDVLCPSVGYGCWDVLPLGADIAVTGGTISSDRDMDLSVVRAPVIVKQPEDQWVLPFGIARLTAAVAGETAGMTFQWYTGAVGDTSNPVPNWTSYDIRFPVTPSTEGRYWLRVTNGSGTADSDAVQVGIGRPPVITTQPESPVIVSGQAVNLTVTATANTLVTYQWFRGTSGETSTPIAGATGSLFTTPALTTATNYWVRASTAFGSVDSATAAITIGVAPTIATQPEDRTILAGESTTLSVTAAGTAPFSYQWYEGTSGSTGNPVAGATGSTLTTPVLVADTQYWVRVSSPYGAVDSDSATVTVIPEIGRPLDFYVKSRNGNLVTFAWTAGQGQLPVTGHIVEGGLYGQAAVLAQLPTGSGATTFTLNVPNGTFWLQVRAVSGVESGDPSEQIRLCMNTPCPAITPVNLLGTVDGSSIALAWRNPLESGVPTRVTLQLSGSLTTSLDLPGTAEAFAFPSVPNGTYNFRVVACTSTGCSEPSEPVQLSFPAACTGRPDEPARFMVSKAGNAITIDWELPETGSAPTGFVLNVESAVFTGPLPVSGRRFTTPPVPAGNYTLSVAGVNACGTGTPTTRITVSIP